jgi:hypothetical protein
MVNGTENGETRIRYAGKALGKEKSSVRVDADKESCKGQNG